MSNKQLVPLSFPAVSLGEMSLSDGDGYTQAMYSLSASLATGITMSSQPLAHSLRPTRQRDISHLRLHDWQPSTGAPFA